MVVSIQSFYGDALPRPFVVLGVTARTDAPHVNDALLEWAKDAPFRAGGLNFQRTRQMGRIEGKLKKKGGRETKEFDALDESEVDDDEASPGGTARSSGGLQRTPKTKSKRRGSFGKLKRKTEGTRRRTGPPSTATRRKDSTRSGRVGSAKTTPANTSSGLKGEKRSLDKGAAKGSQSAFTRLLRKEQTKKAGVGSGPRGSRGQPKTANNPVALTAAAAAAATKRNRSKSSTFDFPANSDDEEHVSPKLRRLRK
eukprot:scaffold68_cov340-Pavlova_lutheri.AAC.10